MADAKHYVIRGGIEGRERLRILARVMHPTTTALFDSLALKDGMACLDVGCGGGDATLELARRVAPHGKAVGTDIDHAKLELARGEALQHGVANVEFRLSDVREASGVPEFDLVYARFLLTHLSDPAGAVRAFYQHVRPGGFIVVEDIDVSGCFTFPESEAHSRYQELYCTAVNRRGGDPNIGPRLPFLLRDCGLEEVSVSAVQPLGLRGEVKLIAPLTMENIADVVLQENLATREEIDDLVRELYALAADENTLVALPRIVQSWGRRPVGSDPTPS
jgi:SAM-dependent methyltransferase